MSQSFEVKVTRRVVETVTVSVGDTIQYLRGPSILKKGKVTHIFAKGAKFVVDDEVAVPLNAVVVIRDIQIGEALAIGDE